MILAVFTRLVLRWLKTRFAAAVTSILLAVPVAVIVEPASNVWMVNPLATVDCNGRWAGFGKAAKLPPAMSPSFVLLLRNRNVRMRQASLRLSASRPIQRG